MTKLEFEWVCNQIAKHANMKEPGHLLTVLNLGSGKRNLFSEPAGDLSRCIESVRFINVDMFESDVVDIVGNLSDQSVIGKILEHEYDLIVCCNMLEHVPVRESLYQALTLLASRGANIVITVPYRFRFHKDPIDTKYRPTPQEIASELPSFVVDDQRIVPSDFTHYDFLRQNLKNPVQLLTRLLLPFYKPNEYYKIVSDLPYIFKKPLISCVSLSPKSICKLPRSRDTGF